jgi:hypothetical protein
MVERYRVVDFARWVGVIYSIFQGYCMVVDGSNILGKCKPQVKWGVENIVRIPEDVVVRKCIGKLLFVGGIQLLDGSSKFDRVTDLSLRVRSSSGTSSGCRRSQLLLGMSVRSSSENVSLLISWARR